MVKRELGRKREENNFFRAIEYGTRRKILHELWHENARSTDLAKKLKIDSIQVLQKHTKELLKTGLVQKDDNTNLLHLTEVGKAIVPQIESIDFLEKNRKYFQTHSLSFLPKEFVERIGELNVDYDGKNSGITKGIGSTIKKYEEILDNTHKFAKIISSQIIYDANKYAIAKFKENHVQEVIHIVGKNTDFPKEWNNYIESEEVRELIKIKRLKRRMIETVQITLHVSESNALVAFPYIDGHVDLGIVFFSNEEKFRHWCNDLFDYIYAKSYVCDEIKIKEILRERKLI